MSLKAFYPQARIVVNALLQLSRTTDELQMVQFVTRPRSIKIERNDFNTADTIEIELDSVRFPILPRLIRQVHLQVYAGDMGGLDIDDATGLQDKFLQFIGYVDEPELTLSDEDGTIRWKARDYTGLLLDDRRVPQSIVPTYADTLDVALRRILDHLEGGANIKLSLVGLDSWPSLAQSAAPGLGDAKIPVKPEDTAWHLVKRACDPFGLIPQIKLDVLQVGVSRGISEPARRPVFVYGVNLTNFTEKRNLGLTKEGIGLNAYSLETRRYITSLYPPTGDPRIKKTLKNASRRSQNPPGIPGTGDRRKWFPYGTVSNQTALDVAAQALYSARSRQEFEGQFTCARMVVPDDVITLNSDDFDTVDDFDVTQLANGDRIFLAFDPGYSAVLGNLQTRTDREQYLVDQGYDANVANFMVRAFEVGADGPLEVYLRKACHTYNDDGYELVADWQNLLTIASV